MHIVQEEDAFTDRELLFMRSIQNKKRCFGNNKTHDRFMYVERKPKNRNNIIVVLGCDLVHINL